MSKETLYYSPKHDVLFTTRDECVDYFPWLAKEGWTMLTIFTNGYQPEEDAAEFLKQSTYIGKV